MFGADDPGLEALGSVLQRLGAARTVTQGIPLRAHQFVRTIRGMWACCNPECRGAGKRDDGRAIGRLYDVPASTCTDCGSRVLELLYCFECGDVSLGGFVVQDAAEGKVLGSTPVAIPAIEARPVFRRTLEEYVWYWPGEKLATTESWSHATPKTDDPKVKRSKVTFAFMPVALDPALGMAHEPDGAAYGWTLRATGLPNGSGHSIPALPERCPRCDTEYWNDLRTFFGSEVRSPIRAHTSGSAQSTQLYLSQLVRSMGTDPQDSKTIVFTDSRDDAARTAAGVGRNHYRDVVRQVVRQAVDDEIDLHAVLQREVGGDADLSQAESLLAQQFKSAHPEPCKFLQKAQWVPLTPEEQMQVDDALDLATSTAVPWGQLMASIVDAFGQAGHGARRSRPVCCEEQRRI